jgi:capsular exopolysaccharide synthesis family protein
VQDHTNQSLRHPGEAMMRLGVRELGVIPSAGENIAKVKSLRIYKSAAALEDRLSGIGETEADNQGHAPTTDDFRTLLTSIMFSGDDGNQPKLVVITSSSPQEGKTTVASNLAIAFARAGKRVLLIDGDLRKPQVHQLFGLPNAVGLSNLLQGSSTVGEAQRPILATSIPRLSVLTSGSLTETPADLLFEPHLRVLLASYRERFEMVVVDSPPMMRMPDARLLGRNSDGVILVARANKTTRTSIHLASQRLALDNSRLLGVVLNDWSGEESQYPSYS